MINMKLPRMVPMFRKRTLRHMIIFLAINLFLMTLLVITKAEVILILQVGFVVGWVLGSVLSYNDGLKDEVLIIEKVYGEEWDRYAVLGKRVSQAANN